jgi:hypothetical protein
MRAEKKSRWRADVAHAACPPPRRRRRFPFSLLGNRLWSKQVRTRELKEPGQLIRSHCGFYIVIPKANWSFMSESLSKEHILRTNSIGVMKAISNWSHDPSNLFKPTEQNYSTTALNI